MVLCSKRKIFMVRSYEAFSILEEIEWPDGALARLGDCIDKYKCLQVLDLQDRVQLCSSHSRASEILAKLGLPLKLELVPGDDNSQRSVVESDGWGSVLENQSWTGSVPSGKQRSSRLTNAQTPESWPRNLFHRFFVGNREHLSRVFFPQILMVLSKKVLKNRWLLKNKA